MQLSFPFVWPAHAIAHCADKSMPLKLSYREPYGTTMIYRLTEYNIWAVSTWVPVFGPSGRVGAMVCRYYGPFFKGREAWSCAKCVSSESGKPFLEQGWEDAYVAMAR